MSDLRRVARIPVDLPARYRSPAISLDGRASNLSHDGVYFTCASDMSGFAGKVNLEIDLPDEPKPVAVLAEICWRDLGGIGLRFLEIPMLYRRRLANYVMHRCYSL
jgi:hypothetical protein